MVEEMSCVFIGFFDEMIQTEAIATQYPGLVSSLRWSVARVLALAKEVVDIDGDLGVELESTRESQDRMVINAAMEDTGSETPELVPSYETERFMAEEPPEILPKVTYSTSPGVVMLTEKMTTSPDFYSLSSQATSPFSLPSQIYGNGWDPSTTPPSHMEMPIKLPSASTQSLLRSLDSFPLRLLETTLSHAYYSLTIDQIPEAFGWTLRFRKKEELIASIRWLLGPGRDYIYRASGLTWGSKNGNVAVFPPYMPNPPSLGGGFGPDEAAEEPFDYLTVIGVHEQLQNLGARVIDSDTIEISVSGPKIQREFSNFQPPPSLPQPDTWSYFDFFSTHRLQSNPLTMKLSVSLLTLNLAQKSLCFARGPGFPRKELGRVLEASVTMAHGG